MKMVETFWTHSRFAHVEPEW